MIVSIKPTISTITSSFKQLLLCVTGLKINMDDHPYRCPKCGDSEAFATLRHLRDHLDKSHSYQSPWGKKTVVITGRNSPLSEHFRKETEELENQLKMAQEAEQLHKIQWNSRKKSLFNSTDRTMKNEEKYNYSLLSEITPNTPTTPSIQEVEITTGPSLMDMKDTKSPYEEYQARLVRKPDPHMSNMLTKATKQMQSLRQSTNELIMQQKAEMQRLKQQLELKDTQVAKANQELTKLTDESTKLQRELLELEKRQNMEKGEVDLMKDQLKQKDQMIELKQE